MQVDSKEPQENAYFVEVDDNGCPKCGAGRTYRVIGPDGMGSSTSYADVDDAEHEADILNEAFERGESALEGQVRDMAMLIERCLRHIPEDKKLYSQAVDYLNRKGLRGSCLREEVEP